MQRILGKMRRAVEDYNMIQSGDRIAVGLSGGKDSFSGFGGRRSAAPFLSGALSFGGHHTGYGNGQHGFFATHNALRIA